MIIAVRGCAKHEVLCFSNLQFEVIANSTNFVKEFAFSSYTHTHIHIYIYIMYININHTI